MLRPGLLYRAAMEGATFSLLAGMRRLQDYGLAARCAAAEAPTPWDAGCRRKWRSLPS